MEKNSIQKIKSYFFLLFLMPFFLVTSTQAYLPNSAYTLPLPSDIPAGSIIVETGTGFQIATGNRNESFVGVLVDQADFVYRTDEERSGRPVVSTGIVPMRLQNSTGQIVTGDSITFSKATPGVGVEAQEQDIVIAVAQEVVTGNDIQLASVQIDLRNGNGNTEQADDSSIFAQELEHLLKGSADRIVNGETNPALYLLAVIVVILAAVFALVLFGRISISGITAIGRNPLAKNSIILGIVINTGMVILFVILTVLAAAYIVR